MRSPGAWAQTDRKSAVILKHIQDRPTNEPLVEGCEAYFTPIDDSGRPNVSIEGLLVGLSPTDLRKISTRDDKMVIGYVGGILKTYSRMRGVLDYRVFSHIIIDQTVASDLIASNNISLEKVKVLRRPEESAAPK